MTREIPALIVSSCGVECPFEDNIQRNAKAFQIREESPDYTIPIHNAYLSSSADNKGHLSILDTLFETIFIVSPYTTVIKMENPPMNYSFLQSTTQQAARPDGGQYIFT